MNNNKPNKIRDDKRFNDFLATSLESNLENRFCSHCHVRLVHNPRNSQYDRYLYSCPKCNCTANIHQTEPEERIMVQFPTHNAQSSSDKRLITQSDDQRLSRSQYFIQKNLSKRNEVENNDPYLAMLKQNNKITITNIDYADPIE